MVNGMNTVQISLCFLVAKEISKTPPLYEFAVKYNVWATIYKEKKLFWFLPDYTTFKPDEKQP